MTVYVRWYGNVLHGELLDGEYLGMKQVRIPVDGRHPIALFTPGNVYDSPEQMQQLAKEMFSYPKQFPKPEEIIHPNLPAAYPADDYIKLEQFKRENWDHERGHLRIDKLDEFYQLWRMAMGSFGNVESKHIEAEAVHDCVHPFTQQPKGCSEKPQKPTKKMRCWRCEHLDYDYIGGCQEQPQSGEHFCGLHGRARVDPDGEQVNLDRKGGCGFNARKRIVELSLFD